ncbi:protein [Escherichia coli]|nr:protein [Escherichia coli]SQM25924.1 protein [Escherichia coli]
MRFIIRTVMLIALVWIGLLLSGYGVLIVFLTPYLQTGIVS